LFDLGNHHRFLHDNLDGLDVFLDDLRLLLNNPYGLVIGKGWRFFRFNFDVLVSREGRKVFLRDLVRLLGFLLDLDDFLLNLDGCLLDLDGFYVLLLLLLLDLHGLLDSRHLLLLYLESLLWNLDRLLVNWQLNEFRLNLADWLLVFRLNLADWLLVFRLLAEFLSDGEQKAILLDGSLFLLDEGRGLRLLDVDFLLLADDGDEFLQYLLILFRLVPKDGIDGGDGRFGDYGLLDHDGLLRLRNSVDQGGWTVGRNWGRSFFFFQFGSVRSGLNFCNSKSGRSCSERPLLFGRGFKRLDRQGRVFFCVWSWFGKQV
jgi:hypothetical protein